MKENNDMDADASQWKRRNNKCYVSTFFLIKNRNYTLA